MCRKYNPTQPSKEGCRSTGIPLLGHCHCSAFTHNVRALRRQGHFTGSTQNAIPGGSEQLFTISRPCPVFDSVAGLFQSHKMNSHEPARGLIAPPFHSQHMLHATLGFDSNNFLAVDCTVPVFGCHIQARLYFWKGTWILSGFMCPTSCQPFHSGPKRGPERCCCCLCCGRGCVVCDCNSVGSPKQTKRSLLSPLQVFHIFWGGGAPKGVHLNI